MSIKCGYCDKKISIKEIKSGAAFINLDEFLNVPDVLCPSCLKTVKSKTWASLAKKKVD